MSTMASSSSSSSSCDEYTVDAEGKLWEASFEWEIEGAEVGRVWEVVRDFGGLGRWGKSLVAKCEPIHVQSDDQINISEEEAAGGGEKGLISECIRGDLRGQTRVVRRRVEPAQAQADLQYHDDGSGRGAPDPAPSLYAIERLVAIDDQTHTLSYTLEECTVPLFSMLQDYVSTITLSPASPSPPHGGGLPSSTLLQWRYQCRPSPSLSQQAARDLLFSVYHALVSDLKTYLLSK